jgi:hypothetical protein
MAILDVDGPDAHRRVAAVTLWNQHTRVGSCRLSLHVPSLQVIDRSVRTQYAAKLGQVGEIGRRRLFPGRLRLGPFQFYNGLRRRNGRSSIAWGRKRDSFLGDGPVRSATQRGIPGGPGASIQAPWGCRRELVISKGQNSSLRTTGGGQKSSL